MTLYRKPAGGFTWSANSPDTTCTLDSNYICTFNTDHLSSFTFMGSPSTFYISGNASYTNTETTSLDVNIPGATWIRFANTGGTRSSRYT
jgi:hypothetical protein